MKTSLLALALLAGLTPAIAQDGVDPADDDQACADAETTVAIVECLDGLHASWDERLNLAYHTAIEPLDGARRIAFRDVQRTWLAFRDANCTYYRSGEGTIAAIDGASCMYRLTRERAQELEAMAAL